MTEKNIVYKVEDIFQDDPEDENNTIMTIPEEILREKGWGEGTRIKIEVGDHGTIIITEIKEENE